MNDLPARLRALADELMRPLESLPLPSGATIITFPTEPPLAKYSAALREAATEYEAARSLLATIADAPLKLEILQQTSAARITELEAALRPFAAYARHMEEGRGLDLQIGYYADSPKMSDCRHAALVLAKGAKG